MFGRALASADPHRKSAQVALSSARAGVDGRGWVSTVREMVRGPEGVGEGRTKQGTREKPKELGCKSFLLLCSCNPFVSIACSALSKEFCVSEHRRPTFKGYIKKNSTPLTSFLFRGRNSFSRSSATNILSFYSVQWGV